MADDLALLEAWRGGDKDAGDELLSRYFDPVCRFFRSKIGDDVEDLIQRTFLDCVEGSGRIREAAGFRGYLFAIARNRLYDHLRARARHPERVDLSVQSVEDLGTSPSGVLARDEQERLLLSAMRRLSVDHQVILELAYWHDLSGKQIAAALDIAENTVRSRLARARTALREQVERAAASPSLRKSTLASVDGWKLQD